MFNFSGREWSAIKILSILLAVPAGVFVPFSQASTVLFDTPITAAKVLCVIFNLQRSSFISAAE